VRVLAPFSGSPAVTDAVATVAAFPLVVIGIIAFAIAALAASNANALFTGVLPLAFAACAIAIADIASREKRAGTTALVFAAPGLRTRFVWWKFASTLIVALAFLAVPLASAIVTRPRMTIALSWVSRSPPPRPPPSAS
jgi:ABC-type transport system involved in multi-copper enzyme maturation permease subunit